MARQFYQDQVPLCSFLTGADVPISSNLPVPEDHGACSHLSGSQLPSILVPSISGTSVDVPSLSALSIVFCYPRAGAPGETITDDWNAIPGARGCTPQACSFRDEIDRWRRLGVTNVFGLSAQDTPYQAEAKMRLQFSYKLLSDGELKFAKLPTFEGKGTVLIKRLALAIEQGNITKVWYASFPPVANTREVTEWLVSIR